MTATRSSPTGAPVAPVALGCPISQGFDPFSAVYQADPAGWMADARTSSPVFFSALLDCYVVTRWSDIREVMKDTRAFSTEGNGEPFTPLPNAALAVLDRGGFVRTKVLGSDDSPEHARRRKALRQPFQPELRETLEPRIRAVVNGYIDRFVRRGNADLVSELFAEAPAVVALEFMGVPNEDVATAKRFADGTLAFLFGRPSADEQVHRCEAMVRHQAYARDLIRRLQDDPSGPGLLPHAVRAAADDPDLFGEEWLIGLATTTLAAAHETTSGALANAALLLLGDARAGWQAICADPGLIPTAVEECLRLGPSLTAQRRTCTNDTEIGGVRIPAGAKVLVALASGNVDADAFDEPESFDVRRQEANRHLTFGFGAHLCLGAPLARLQMRVALEELTRRLPHLRLVDDQTIEFPVNAAARAARALLVEWEPADNPLEADRP